MDVHKLNKAGLSKLSKEEKLKIIQALEEKERRERISRKQFKPNPIQEKILKSDAWTKICTASNGVGKTTLGVHLMWQRAIGVDPWKNKNTKVPINIIVVVDNSSKIEDVWINELRKWFDFEHHGIELRKNGKPYVNEIVWRNGSRAQFYTWEMNDVMFESKSNTDLIIADEPLPRPIYIALSRGQRDKNVQFETLIIGTPIGADAAWLRTDFIEPWTKGLRPGVECFTGSIYDNAENLGEGYIERFAALLTEKEKRIRLNGEFSDIDSLAFGHLIKDSVHQIQKEQIQWMPDWPCVVGIDNHNHKPHTAVLVGRNPETDKLYVLKELSLKATAREFASALLAWTLGYKVVEWVCDSLGSGEGTAFEGFKSFIQVLNDCGVRARATTFEDKTHEEAIARIREMLALEDSGPPLFERSPRLKFIESETVRTYKELCNIAFVYDKKKEVNKPRLDSAKLDYFSALTYALSSKYLAKTIGNYGTMSRIVRNINQPKLGGHTAANLAKGLGIQTSKRSSNLHKQPMRRLYTRTGLSRDTDDD